MEARIDTSEPFSKFTGMPSRALRAVRRWFVNETWCAALLLAALLMLDFLPCIFGHKSLLESAQFCDSVLHSGAWAGKRLNLPILPKTLDPAAAAWFTEPSLAITGWEYWRARTLPLWNPYQGLGQPYAADMQSQPFFPLTVLFSLHVTPTTYNLFLLCRLFVAGMGAYLYLRLFTSFLPALAGGITMTLAGYFLMVISLPYVSVEILTPLALFAAESLLTNPSRKSFCGFALAIALVLLGGMPESALLTYIFVGSYISFRILFDSELRQIWMRRSLSALTATIAGLCLSAFLLWPMVELLHHSYNTHDPAKNMGNWIPGLWHERLDASIFTYILPLLFGPPFTGTIPDVYNGNGARNFAGAIALFLILVALCSLRRSTSPIDRRLTSITWFFSVCATVIILKRYGFPPINALGNLPFLRMITLLKYDEPILSTCIAVLCGIGLQRMVTKAASWGTQIVALSATFSVVVLSAVVSRNVLQTAISNHRLSPIFPFIALTLPICLLFCLAIVYAVRAWANDKKVRSLTVIIVVFLATEASLNYIPEVYYAFSELPDTSENPYAGAPYIQWLKTNNSDGYRVFARGGALYPDWAAVFQVSDIRDLDALYYWKYLPFVRNFMLPLGQLGVSDFNDRFTGAGQYEYAFRSPVERRLLELTSCRYLITNAPYSERGLQLKYDHEVRIYRYDNVLPRVALYSRAKIAKNDAEVLQTLADPGFDTFSTVVLNSVQLGPAENDHVAAMNQGVFRSAASGEITNYQPMTVQIDASLPTSSVLVLNDAEYPGWEVEVDGKPTKILSANYLFRGVLLGPGKHRVSFSYRPRSFRYGATLSLSTAFGLLIYCVYGGRQRSRRSAELGTRP